MAVKNLVVSIIQFLKQELDAVSSESRESLEVAIECLQNTYNVKESDSEKCIDLLELYKSAAIPLPPEATPDAKVKAEDLKNEGNQLMKLEKYQEALANYTKAIELDGQNAVYYGNRAAVYSKLGNHRLAVEDSLTALKINPSYSKAYGRLGLAYSSLNRHNDAKHAYKKALEMEPDNESYKSNLQLAEEQLAQNNTEGPGMTSDLMSLISNPTLVNIAQRMMHHPSLQNFIRNGDDILQEGRMDRLFEVGQQFLQTVQTTNPEFIETIVQEMNQNRDPEPPQQN